MRHHFSRLPVMCLTMILICLISSSCVPQPSLNSLQQGNYNSAALSAESRNVFSYVLTHGKLPEQYLIHYPSKASRAQEYQKINAEWNSVKRKYSGTRFTLDFINDFPMDLGNILVDLSKLAKRASVTVPTSTNSNNSRVQKISTTNNQDILLIPPYSIVEWDTKGNCLDPSVPAPRTGDKFKITRVGDLIPEELMPVYRCIIKKASTDKNVRKYQQKLVWAMRTISSPGKTYADNLSQAELAVLDQCIPNSSRTFTNLRQKEKAKAEGLNFLKDILNSVDLPILGGLGDLVIDGSLEGVENRLQDLFTAPIREAIRNDGYEYGALDNNVFTQAVGSGTLALKIRIINASNMPYAFQATNFMAIPQRKVQRVTLSPPQNVKVNYFANQENIAAAQKEDLNFLEQMARKIEGTWNGYIPAALGSFKKDWKNLMIGVQAGSEVFTPPILSALQTMYELETGRKLFTGEKLTDVDKLLGQASLVYGGFKNLKYLAQIYDASKAGKSATKIANDFVDENLIQGSLEGTYNYLQKLLKKEVNDEENASKILKAIDFSEQIFANYGAGQTIGGLTVEVIAPILNILQFDEYSKALKNIAEE